MSFMSTKELIRLRLSEYGQMSSIRTYTHTLSQVGLQKLQKTPGQTGRVSGFGPVLGRVSCSKGSHQSSSPDRKSAYLYSKVYQ